MSQEFITRRYLILLKRSFFAYISRRSCEDNPNYNKLLSTSINHVQSYTAMAGVKATLSKKKNCGQKERDLANPSG
jgi:hypothetical protein